MPLRNASWRIVATFGSMRFGPAKPNGEFATIPCPSPRERRHVRPPLRARVAPRHQHPRVRRVHPRPPARRVGRRVDRTAGHCGRGLRRALHGDLRPRDAVLMGDLRHRDAQAGRGVVVGRDRGRRGGEAHRATAAGLVLADDRLTEVRAHGLGERAPARVDRAAGRPGANQRDRLRREAGGDDRARPDRADGKPPTPSFRTSRRETPAASPLRGVRMPARLPAPPRGVRESTRRATSPGGRSASTTTRLRREAP